jgi:hypothetical protein
MKISVLRLIILSIFALFACENKDENSTFSDELIGYWINPQVSDTNVTYEKSDALKESEYGFAFQSGGEFIERKNSGWCATPPISYTDFSGTWHKNDSIIDITVGYWGGFVEYQWKIVAVENTRLTISSISEEYHESNP